MDNSLPITYSKEKSKFLGIDLGTTSIKISLINAERRLLDDDKLHSAQRECSISDGNEQCLKKIIKTLNEIIQNANTTKNFDQLNGVGIAGQMHGIVLWECDTIASLDNCNCSRLITWMDGRCDQQFLNKLPKWIDKAYPDQNKMVASGYGMATLAWLKEHGQIHPRWDRAGTIMDFLAAFLTQSKEVFISTQNAESWGYANMDHTWTNNDCSSTFPTHLFPKIVRPGVIIGRVSIEFAGIPVDTPVFVPIGDLQASLLPVLHPKQAALHIGTSSQLAFIKSNDTPMPTLSSIVQVPYFEDNFLLVAASLNGGNALDCFIKQIATWSHQLFGSPCEEQRNSMDYSKLLKQILQSKNSLDVTSKLNVNPTFFGERHKPQRGLSIEGWQPETSLNEFIIAIARGLIQNLAEMMPPSILSSHEILCLELIGRSGQHVFVEEAKRQFPNLDVFNSENEEVSAAFGAALYALQSSKLTRTPI